MRKLCSLLMSLAILFNMALPVGATWTSGDGISLTENHESVSLLGAHELRTAADVVAIAVDMSGSYTLMNDIDLSTLGEWTPIEGDFSGTFDGQGYSITGLNFKYNSSNSSFGLFRTIDSGVVRNLHVDAYVYRNNDQSGEGGALAWRMTNATVENCYVTGSLQVMNHSEANQLGCMAGFCYGSLFTNCYATAKLYLGGSSSRANLGHCGGIVGKADDASVFTNCYYAGNMDSYQNKANYAKAYGIASGGTQNQCYYQTNDALNDGKSEILMKLQANYSGWDFNTVWGIDVQMNDGYPYLRVDKNWATFTVRFNPNGGEVSQESKILTKQDTTYGSLPTPTREGYTFEGWYTATDGGERIWETTQANLTSNQTLYAVWSLTVERYTVEFEGNGGTVSTQSKTVEQGGVYGNLPVPSRSGYIFQGWFTDAVGGTQITADSEVNLSQNQTLYAHWQKEPETYTVYFEGNGVTVSPSSKTVTQGEAYGELPAPTRNGYSLDGWYTAASGGTQVTASTTVNLSGNQTLYAHWSPVIITYTVTFEGNGVTVSPSSKTVTQGETYSELPAPTRDGYTLDGWYTAVSGGTQVTASTTVNLSGNQTLYAHWSPVIITYTVTFEGNGVTVSPSSKTVTQGETYGELPAPTREGYAFGGWFTAADNGTQVKSDTTVNLTADQTLYAHWTPTNSYTVTFDANDGTGTPSPQIKDENLPLTLSNLKPSKTYVLQYNANGGSVSPASKNVSCTFINWNTEKNGGGTSYNSGDSYTVNADVTLYAQWTNPLAGALATPSRTGYDFVGWFTSATDGEQVSESSTVNGSLSLYAHWTNPYNIGDETYSFENYGDSHSPFGHCFGMSMTSAGYHNHLLDIGRIGGNVNTSLYSFGETQAVKQPICYYQSIQGSYSARAVVAGGSFYLNRGYNIASDWQEVVSYVRNHNYDNTGLLQIGFRQGTGGHAINFLRYESVNGQDRIYAYDNNYPDQETYFYRDSSGSVRQAPVQTFAGAIDCIALRDCRIYFNSVGDFDATHVLYMAKDAATVQGYTYSYMEGIFSDEEYVMYEIPANQSRVIIIPNRDNADFIYMDTEYSFGNITDETCGELRFASLNEGAVVADASFRIFEDNSVSPTVTLDKTALTLNTGESETLTATVVPDNAPNKNVTWTSSESSVATVIDGKVMAVKPGTAIITVTTNDGNAEATCTVTVLSGPQLSITLTETTLHYEIVGFDIDKAILFIADYDALGKMLHVQQVSPPKQAGNISVEEAASHQAFLLDSETLAPLCAKALAN